MIQEDNKNRLGHWETCLPKLTWDDERHSTFMFWDGSFNFQSDHRPGMFRVNSSHYEPESLTPGSDMGTVWYSMAYKTYYTHITPIFSYYTNLLVQFGYPQGFTQVEVPTRVYSSVDTQQLNLVCLVINWAVWGTEFWPIRAELICFLQTLNIVASEKIYNLQKTGAYTISNLSNSPRVQKSSSFSNGRCVWGPIYSPRPPICICCWPRATRCMASGPWDTPRCGGDWRQSQPFWGILGWSLVHWYVGLCVCVCVCLDRHIS